MLDEHTDWAKVEGEAAKHAMALAEKRAEMDREFYGKLAEWGERFALAIMVSLVIQQLSSQSLTLMIIALIATAASYAASFLWLKKSKTL